MAKRLILLILVASIFSCASCRRLARHAASKPLVAEDGLPGASRALLYEEETVIHAPPSRLGKTLPGRYIVMFKRGAASDVAHATLALKRHVRRSMAAAAAAALKEEAAANPGMGNVETADAKDPFDLQVISSIGGTSGTPAAAAAASVLPAATADGNSTTGSSRTLQGVVIAADPTIIEHVRASEDVEFVLPDRVIAAQVTYCLRANSLARGITARPTVDFQWDQCYTSGAQLVWVAKRCGKNGEKVRYTELRAVDAQTGELLRAQGKDCIAQPNNERPVWTKATFGSCGVAPLYADAQMPTAVCGSSARGSVPYPGPASSGSGSGGNNSQPAIPGGGSALNSGANPTDVVTRLQYVPLSAGETVPEGLLRIEAVTAEGVANTASLPVDQQVVVAVMDSGVDLRHPDINYVGGTSFLPDKGDAGVDGFGHGTHCAGIIGAKNNGQGVVGVSPGVPIYSLRVLDNNGGGSLSDLMSAVKWAATEGIKKGIRVLNLSLATLVKPDSPDYQSTYSALCGLMQEAGDAGLVITVAAGNFGASLLPSYLPASCPGVIAVTAIEGSAAASISNYLPDSAVGAADSPMVLAAPGIDVLSTLPLNVDPTGYGLKSGTSMAAPHVAGVAANCIMSGACAAGTTSLEKLATIQKAAQKRLSMSGAPAYGFAGDATNTMDGKYYGYLVHGGLAS